MFKHITATFAALTVAAGIVAAPAQADYNVGCQKSPFLYGLRMTNRTICDGPIREDGSWMRIRNFYSPQYWRSGWCSRYSCSSGYWVQEFDRTDGPYPVTPDTVLPDEPGHLAEGAV